MHGIFLHTTYRSFIAAAGVTSATLSEEGSLWEYSTLGGEGGKLVDKETLLKIASAHVTDALSFRSPQALSVFLNPLAA